MFCFFELLGIMVLNSDLCSCESATVDKIMSIAKTAGAVTPPLSENDIFRTTNTYTSTVTILVDTLAWIGLVFLNELDFRSPGVKHT